jgi:hypothetical protein
MSPFLLDSSRYSATPSRRTQADIADYVLVYRSEKLTVIEMT